MNACHEIGPVLSDILRRLPDMRYGQLVCNIAHMARGYAGPTDVWDVEDDEFLAAAREMLSDLIENGIDHSVRTQTPLAAAG